METLTNDNFTGANHEAPRPNKPLRYLTASSIIGDKVYDEEGKHMGKIEDLMVDVTLGKIDYFIIEFGGFLGIGIKYFAIPFRMLRVDPDKKVFVFTQKKEMLEKAPGFDLNHWPDTNAHWQEEYWSFI